MKPPISNVDSANSSANIQSDDHLIAALTPFVSSLGYQIIHVSMQTYRQKCLKIFIDHLDSAPGKGIGIEDCTRVSKALDEPLENDPELQRLFQGSYELEVSSPGLDRPLRTPRDFQNFAGQRVRLHTFRALTAEETGNPGYHQKNPKQKNFLGTLLGFKENKVEIEISTEENKKVKKSKAKGKAALEKSKSEEGRITIPLQLISKANLEPVFAFEESEEREGSHV